MGLWTQSAEHPFLGMFSSQTHLVLVSTPYSEAIQAHAKWEGCLSKNVPRPRWLLNPGLSH